MVLALSALLVLLACTPGQTGFHPALSGSVFKPPVNNIAPVGSPVQVAPPNPAPAPVPTPLLVNPLLSGGSPSAPAPPPAAASVPEASSSSLSGVPFPAAPAPVPAPAPSGNAPPGGFFNPTKTDKSPYGQISTNHVMNMNFGINMAVSFIKRVENKDDKYCQTHCLNDLQNCAVAVHCDWTAPTTTAAPCTGNIFQCGSFTINRGGSTTNKGVCLFFEEKTGSEDTDPGVTSESNCKEVIYHPTCRDWTVGVPDHWVPTGKPTFQTGAALSRSFLCEEGYKRSGLLKVTCDHAGVKTAQAGASCTKPGESITSTGGGLPTIDIPVLPQVNTFLNRPSVVTTRKPDTTSFTTSSTTTTSPTTSGTTSSTTTTSPTTSSTTSSTTTSPTTSSTTSSTTTTSLTTSSTTSSTTTSPTTSSTTSSTTTTSPTTSSTTSSTTTTSPTTSATTSSTTTTSPTTSSTTSSTTTSPTTSATTSSTTTTSPTTSSTTSSKTTTSPTTSSTTSGTTSPTTSSTTSTTTTTTPTTSSTTSSTTTTSPTTSSTTSGTTTTSPSTSPTTSTTSTATSTATTRTTTTTSSGDIFYFAACDDFTINSVTKEEAYKVHAYDDHTCYYYSAGMLDTQYPSFYCYTSNWNSGSGSVDNDAVSGYLYDRDRKGKQCEDLCPMFIDLLNDLGMGGFFTVDTTMTCYYYGALSSWFSFSHYFGYNMFP